MKGGSVRALCVHMYVTVCVCGCVCMGASHTSSTDSRAAILFWDIAEQLSCAFLLQA